MVADAKARLSEILRLPREEDPQRFGARPHYVVVTEAEWPERAEPGDQIAFTPKPENTGSLVTSGTPSINACAASMRSNGSLCEPASLPNGRAQP